MTIFESLMDIMKDVDSVEELVDGFEMQPTKKGYKLLHQKEEVCSVCFVNNEDKTNYDMETAQDSAKLFEVCITDIKQEDKIDLYIKKLNALGFENISQE